MRAVYNLPSRLVAQGPEEPKRLKPAITTFLLCISLHAAALAAPVFQGGRPVWVEGREKEMNLFVGFRAVFQAPQGKTVRLRLAASTLYRAYVNGKFLAWGPARGPHGYYRVDELDVTSRLVPGDNLVAIEVAGYNINTYWVLNQPSFLQAEVVAGDTVLASTGGPGAQFQAAVLRERIQRVQRYSFQRAFTEVYRMNAGSARWREDPSAPFQPARLSVAAPKKLLPRRVPYPDYVLRQPLGIAASGQVISKPDTPLWRDRSLTRIGPQLLGFPEDQLEVQPAVAARRLVNGETDRTGRPYRWQERLPLAAGRFYLLDFGTNLSGFIGAQVTVKSPTKLFFTFDEMLLKGDVDMHRGATVNLVAYELEPGVYHLESFEPYTLRWLKAIAVEGECSLDHVYLREYVNPDVWRAHFACSDEGLNRLFAAGRETYRQNAVDLFTDCPHRERAGWLCDSYFTARVEPLLSGGSVVERAFLENFQLPERFEHLPEGMLPMCYPADHYNGQFIPNWSLWFILQLEEYLARTGDAEFAEAVRPRVFKLLDFFKKLHNEDGLLEKLPSWVFIEWSAANKFVQDVNYPSNMLYAGALDAAGRIYRMPELTAEAERIRRVIRSQSFDGEFFVDNAVRQGGKLVPTRNRTETCQYYAFYFGVATPTSHPKLWATLRDRFGPERVKRGEFKEIHESNAFIGNVLRLELLSREGLTRQLINESRAYLLYMADRTGTLWEHQNEQASLNHGFASHIVNTLYRDVLGLYRVNQVAKQVTVRFTDTPVDWCEGRVPVPEGYAGLRWTKRDGTLAYRLDLPAGYEARIDNRSPYRLEVVP